MMKKLRLFEKGVFKNCTDLYHNTDRKWKIRDNVQLCQLYKREYVVQIIRGTKIERILHAWQADVSMFKRVICHYNIVNIEKKNYNC